MRAFEGDAEEVGQAEVPSLHAPFVVEARLVGGDEAAAPLDKRAELRALRVRQRGDVRQDERLERAEVRGVEQPVVHHLERDARLDQRLIPAQRVVLDLRLRKTRRSAANRPGRRERAGTRCAGISPSARNGSRCPPPASATAGHAARRRTW